MSLNHKMPHVCLSILVYIYILTDCVYTEWSGWSPCSVTCNEGHRLRSRDVAEYPLNDGATCQEPLVQADSCYATHCPGGEYL